MTLNFEQDLNCNRIDEIVNTYGEFDNVLGIAAECIEDVRPGG